MWNGKLKYTQLGIFTLLGYSVILKMNSHVGMYRVEKDSSCDTNSNKLLRREYSQKVVKIRHKGPLNILVFSDYHIQDIDLLLEFVKNNQTHPDLIIYAGDALKRFLPPPVDEIILFARKILPYLFRNRFANYPPEIFHLFPLSFTAGLFICMPSETPNIKERIYKMAVLVFDLMTSLEGKIETMENFEDLIAEIKKLLCNRSELRIIQRERPTISDNIVMLELKIIDDNTKTTILHLSQRHLKHLPKPKESLLHSLRAYNLLLSIVSEILRNRGHEISGETIRRVILNSKITRVGEYGNHTVYHLLLPNVPRCNYLEELAKYARYGLAAVRGNDDSCDTLIYGNKVYDLERSWLKLGNFLVIGIEGSTCGVGPLGERGEGVVRKILEQAYDLLDRSEKLIIVSHAPPRGILDRAIRFGEQSIGSSALREFIDEKGDDVVLVICGHVHACGGNYVKSDGVVIVNVSSHDSVFDRANLAWVLLDEDQVKKIDFLKLPSVVENILIRSKTGDEAKLTLIEKAKLSRNEAELFVKYYKKHGSLFLNDIPQLAHLKFRYGFSWDNVLKMYSYGVKSIEDISDEIIERVKSESKGVHIIHLQRAYRKIIGERERGVYLLQDLPEPLRYDDNLIAFDTEYSTDVVLYGFFEMKNRRFVQFWFNEKDALLQYLEKHRDHLFIHWGGADKKFLKKVNEQLKTFNLLFFAQISLVAPIESLSLEEVYDVLCGHNYDKTWEEYFYGMPGLIKSMLCNKILDGICSEEDKKALSLANKLDTLALAEILRKIRTLKVQSSCKS